MPSLVTKAKLILLIWNQCLRMGNAKRSKGIYSHLLFLYSPNYPTTLELVIPTLSLAPKTEERDTVRAEEREGCEEEEKLDEDVMLLLVWSFKRVPYAI